MYDDISSEEEEICEPLTDLINSDDLEDISVHSTDFDFVDEILGYRKYACDERTVITEEAEEIKDTREVILSFSDSDKHDECSDKPESYSDENNNCTVSKTTICLTMIRTVRLEPSGTEEITRYSQIIYSEDVHPKDVDVVSVATHILTEVPKHFTDEHVNVRLVKGDL